MVGQWRVVVMHSNTGVYTGLVLSLLCVDRQCSAVESLWHRILSSVIVQAHSRARLRKAVAVSSQLLLRS